MPNAPSQKSLNEYRKAALREYQAALQWMHEGKYFKAGQVFEKLSQDGPVEILERTRMYLAACQRRGQESGLSFESPEEQYDYAISLLNPHSQSGGGLRLLRSGYFRKHYGIA